MLVLSFGPLQRFNVHESILTIRRLKRHKSRKNKSERLNRLKIREKRIRIRLRGLDSGKSSWLARLLTERKKKRKRRLVNSIKKRKRRNQRLRLSQKGPKKALLKAKQPESQPIDSVAPVEEEEVVVINSRGQRIHPHPYRVE